MAESGAPLKAGQEITPARALKLSAEDREFHAYLPELGRRVEFNLENFEIHLPHDIEPTHRVEIRDQNEITFYGMEWDFNHIQPGDTLIVPGAAEENNRGQKNA